MATSPSSGSSAWHDAVPVLAAAIVPLLLGLGLTVFEASRTVDRQLRITAGQVLLHAERTADHAWAMVDRMLPMAGRPCAEVESDLQRLGTLTPYFRSIGLLHGDTIYCSSSFGRTPRAVGDVIHGPVPLAARWSRSVSGIPEVGGRPAVFFATLGDPDGAYANVDAQYLLDFIRALADTRGFGIRLQVGEGVEIGETAVDGTPYPWVPGRVHDVHSTRHPIHIRVESPPAAAVAAWWQAFFAFLPLSALGAVLGAGLVLAWQRRKLSFRDEIRRGIARREFSVHYQPVYDATRHRCGGVEALLRWRRADGSMVRPDVFIAAAEAEGMIVPLTRHLFELVAADVGDWDVGPGFGLAVNIAADHLHDAAFVDDVRAFTAAVAPRGLSITLELTERSLIGDAPEVIERLHTVRREGARIAIDDFGTGHCSLSYLQTFPLDYLKIERGFVNGIESVDGDAPVLDAIIALSHRLALTVVAEGLESPTQFAYLRAHGVTFFQGYLYARPMRAAALQAWLTRRGSLAPGEEEPAPVPAAT